MDLFQSWGLPFVSLLVEGSSYLAAGDSVQIRRSLKLLETGLADSRRYSTPYGETVLGRERSVKT